MGGVLRRVLCLGVLALAVGALSPGSAGAVKLGSPNIDQDLTDFGTGCDGCMYMQRRLPGSKAQAPFSGEIRKWSVVSTSTYDYQLAVMRKAKGGKFKNVGLSSIGSAPGAGEHTFTSSMAIKEGDYIALIGDSVAGVLNPQARAFTFDPAVDFASPAAKPTFQGEDEFQFNATLKH